MKRNTALFGASLVAGVVAAAGLVATSTTSSAAGTYYGVAWADASNSTGSHGQWVTGNYGSSSSGDFWGSASPGKGTFQTVVGSRVSVSVACVGTSTVTTVVGGGAPGVYRAGQSVSLAKFVGGSNVIGTVTFGKAFKGHTAGAYVDMNVAFGPGTYAALAGADCAAATSTTSTTSTTTSTSTSTSPTTSPTSTSSSTTSPTSTSTSTSPTSSPSSSTTPPPTTEPPTPTPTTTTLPVTG